MPRQHSHIHNAQETLCTVDGMNIILHVGMCVDFCVASTALRAVAVAYEFWMLFDDIRICGETRVPLRSAITPY